jgi:DNA-binding transcriptional ArsR family regulator
VSWGQRFEHHFGGRAVAIGQQRPCELGGLAELRSTIQFRLKSIGFMLNGVSAMSGELQLETIGALLADRTRATFMLTLLNGGQTSASALAAKARVSRSLASSHLRKLVDGGMVVVEPQGRQRLYRLASQRIAEALEALILLAPERPVSTLRGAHERDTLRHGRLCYDHLAGRIGVAINDQIVERGFLERTPDGYAVTADGVRKFATIGIDTDVLARAPRPLTRACLDWSERRHHLAGSLGAAFTAELLRRGWVETREASRVVILTQIGRDALTDFLALQPGQLDPVHEERPDALRRAAA